MKNGDLPYSFMYIMRKKFIGKVCPLCNSKMGIGDFGMKNFMPSIQHNKPISKGGGHVLNNISIICRHCNESYRDTETDSLNNDEVKKIWAEYLGGKK